MDKTCVAFVWHYHQPFYRDPETGSYDMPWVRLHGIKDYAGMGLLLRRFPDCKATFNFVPSLVVQFEEYARGGASDKMLDVTGKDAGELTKDEQLFLLDEAFLANEQNMIRPNPRYRELFLMRDRTSKKAEEVLKRFAKSDLMDLQLWANLAWFHPLAIEGDEALKALVHKGRAYTDGEKQEVLAKVREVLASILPLYREMAAGGQIELTTSPFYHPILPLLLDVKVARASRPDIVLPTTRTGWTEDAREHVQAAISFHEEVFGKKPKGMWPPEGAVSDETLCIFKEHGVDWTATDEEILHNSLGSDSSAYRAMVQPRSGLLYRPFSFDTGHGPISLLFRDHILSDLIGFEYGHWEPKKAAEDLVNRIRAAGKSAVGKSPLVAIILDGENAWEFYPRAGVDFLSALYSGLSAAPDLETTTVSEYLEKHPPEAKLKSIFPGSWIRHSFDIWIGSEEDNRAWDLVAAARAFVKEREAKAAEAGEEDSIRAAWEQVRIAEGSDWLWWYGEEHISLQNEGFDTLFRKHLARAYKLLGQDPPGELERPIAKPRVEIREAKPYRSLNVTVDGRRTDYFEWAGAGRRPADRASIAMEAVRASRITEIYYGSNKDFFFLRVDFESEALHVLRQESVLKIDFISPRQLKVAFSGLISGAPRIESDEPLPDSSAAVHRILEARIPVSSLGAKEGDVIEFFVELDGDEGLERIPAGGVVSFRMISEASEDRSWMV